MTTGDWFRVLLSAGTSTDWRHAYPAKLFISGRYPTRQRPTCITLWGTSSPPPMEPMYVGGSLRTLQPPHCICISFMRTFFKTLTPFLVKDRGCFKKKKVGVHGVIWGTVRIMQRSSQPVPATLTAKSHNSQGQITPHVWCDYQFNCSHTLKHFFEKCYEEGDTSFGPQNRYAGFLVCRYRGSWILDSGQYPRTKIQQLVFPEWWKTTLTQEYWDFFTGVSPDAQSRWKMSDGGPVGLGVER